MEKDLLRQLTNNRLLFTLAAVAGTGGGAAAVAQAYCFAAVVDGVFLGGQDLAAVAPWLYGLAAAAAVRAACAWAAETLGYRLAAKVKMSLRQQALARLFALGPVPVVGEKTGELVTTLMEGVESLEAYFARYLPQLILAAAVPLLVAAAVWSQDMVPALLLLVTAPMIPVFMLLIGRWAEHISSGRWEVLSRLSGHFYDVLRGLTTLKLFGRSREQAAVIISFSERFRTATMSVLRVAFLSALALELLATISTALVAVTVGLKLLYGGLAFREALFILVLAPEFYLPLRQLGGHFHAGLAAKAAAARIFALIGQPVPQATAGGASTLGPGMVAVEFAGVSFTYPGGVQPALKSASFRIEPGEKVALVGPSGAGKSTVVNLLLGFVAPERGEVYINGQDLAGLDRAGWLSSVAYIPQFPHLFAASVSENIRMGAEGSEAAVAEAAKAAGAHEFILALPDGYDTVIGEGGRGLSGGEAQRIAIARAFFRQAPLVILDEATASLDPRSEMTVRQALERLMAGRTVLIIAHRLTTVYRADRIIVLEEGRVAETGRHQDLADGDGVYARLVAAGRRAV